MYELPKLTYLFQDLEPFIDTHTMALHYNKHQKNYLNNLNNLLTKNNFDFSYKINELIYHLNEFPVSSQADILFNLGGVLNHSLYWKSMNIPELVKKPTGKLKVYIDKTFGSYDEFWDRFKTKALELKGSGYTFLVLTRTKTLDIINVPNQDTPLLLGYIPLFNIDLWEHAYYINYENERIRYIDNFEKVADYTYASELFDTLINND